MSSDLNQNQQKSLNIAQILNNFLLLYFPDVDTDEGKQAISMTKKFLKELCTQNPQEGKKIIETEGLKYLLQHFKDTFSNLKSKYLFTGIDVDKFIDSLDFELNNKDTIITRVDFQQIVESEQNKRGLKRKFEDDKTIPSSEKTIPKSTQTGDSTKVIISKQVTSDMAIGPDRSFAKDEITKKEESSGTLDFQIIINDAKPESLRYLLMVKNIYAKQLPKMPRDYIVRLVFDKKHRSVVGVKQGRAICSVTFRPFFDNMFGEIAFLAVTGNEQVKGLGTRLMNHLKSYCQSINVFRFLTYADNYAIGYFKKQGFSKEITLEDDKYKGYIKDYDGGTLMECVLRPEINYLDVPSMLKTQKVKVYEKIREISNSHIVHKGLDFSKGQTYDVTKIEGLSNLAGFQPKTTSEEVDELTKKFKLIWKLIRDKENYSWPFLYPVNKKDVPDYYDIIREPMDLDTINNRLNRKFYRTVDIFTSDFRRMFENCRVYNSPATEYYKCSEKLEIIFKEEIKKLLKK
eukprot:gene2676-3872_t